jgi:hypothetical protein
MDNLFSKGTDPEEIFEWGQGVPKDQREEIEVRANTEDIRVAFFYKDGMKGFLTAFPNAEEGMVCWDSDSIEKSDLGKWDEEGQFLEIEYIEEIVHVRLDGSIEVVESLEDSDEEEE